MKFNSAWDSVEKENRLLKLLCGSLLILSLALCIVVLGTTAQAPLIIERSCISRVVQPVNELPSDNEMKSFTEAALGARFNSNGGNDALLTEAQQGYRAREQDELEKQKMKQVVIVNDVAIEKDSLRVDADRLISVGEVRSTLKFPLKVQLARVSRSLDNPYGLKLLDVEQIKAEEKK